MAEVFVTDMVVVQGVRHDGNLILPYRPRNVTDKLTSETARHRGRLDTLLRPTVSVGGGRNLSWRRTAARSATDTRSLNERGDSSVRNGGPRGGA